MHVFVVRHAKAGSRQDWDGPDDLRPLSKKGRRQADGLVKRLFDRPVSSVLSSPSLRCVQTVQPLAEKLGLTVETREALAEGADTNDVLRFMKDLEGSGPVLCTHGDVIPTIFESLAREDGLKLPSDYPCAKGSTWELVKKHGRYVEARYIAPNATQ